MNNKNTQSVQSRTRYDGYLSELRQLVNDADQMRLTLFYVLDDALRKLERCLYIYPDKKTSSYTVYYRDYQQAFVLFRERLAKTFELFHNEYVIPNPFDQTPDEQDLEEWVEEIEDVVQSYRLRRQQKQDLITVIELLDSLERLRELKFRLPGEAGKPFYEALKNAKKTVKQIEKSIRQALDELGIVKINLSLGEYPPPETTRLVGRDENAQGDTVIIAAVILNGYLWNDKLLRKADVIVAVIQENI